MHPTVWLTDRAADDITSEAAARSPLETGGVLVGWRLRGGAEIVVARAIGPGPHASHGRYRFDPDGAWTDRQVERVYAASGRMITYVGDWHSHPNGSPSLCNTDLTTLKAISRRPEARCPRPVMIIAAGSAHDWTLTAHLLRKRPSTVRQQVRSMQPRLYRPDWTTLPVVDI